MVDNRFAFAADRIFDGKSVWTDHVVIVEGDRIDEFLPRASVPDDVKVFYEADTTIIPGLIDTHVHFMRWQGPLYLAYGVTTIRDVGNDLEWILAQRQVPRIGCVPTILCCGPFLDGPRPCHPLVSRACMSEADAVGAVRQILAAGVDGVKFYCDLDAAWLAAMVRAAHEMDRKAFMHCLQCGVRPALEAGVDEFYHLDGVVADVWPDAPPGWLNLWGDPDFENTWPAQQGLADDIAAAGITCTPTLAYWQSQVRIRSMDFPSYDQVQYLPAKMLQWQGVATAPGNFQMWDRGLAAAQRFLGLLLDRQVPILAGTDVPFGAIPPGLSIWHELALLVASGLSPKHALRAATSDAAKFLGRTDLGRITPGAIADLVILKGNPLMHIPTMPQIVQIIHHGCMRQSVDLFSEAKRVRGTVTEDPWSKQFQLHAARAG